MSMSCEEPKSFVIPAIIENGEVKTTEGVVVHDATHPYNNTDDGKPTGSGTGYIFLDNDSFTRFIMDNLNISVIKMMQIFIDNLNFSTPSTDPLVKEIQDKLKEIRDSLEEEIKKVP